MKEVNREERDALYAEIQHLENEEKKIQAALRTKRQRIKSICTCEERIDCFEMTECKHCGTMH